MASQEEWQDARNPSTSPERLSQLAASYPELRPVIAQNPSCPPEVRARIASEAAVQPPLRQSAFPARQAPVPEPYQPTPTMMPAPLPTAGAAAPTPARRPMSTIAVVGLTALAVTLVAIVLAVILWPRGSGESIPVADGTQSSQSQGASGTASDNSGQSEDSQQTAPVQELEQSPQRYVRPAPANALREAKVDTPSKNISCELRSDGAYCSIKDRDFGSGGCSADATWYSIATTTQGVEERCGQSFLGNVGDRFYELQYGQTTVNGDFACTVEETGMTCWNQKTGAGFTLARAGYQTF
ncbi:variant leucine-rich repeat-containing protein [Scrofimicrobium canadense]|uniref:variant leucine-rich repeat-containing protein n=1 Tax=Scrofimicrobium canadense TaxID=2652290 RepID=UPI00197DBF1D|nr:hypothetical protein [Scrofimicrobium canadense]